MDFIRNILIYFSLILFVTNQQIGQTKLAFAGPNAEIFYLDCKPDDELYGTKLSSIINYVTKTVGISFEGRQDEYDLYYRSCKAFEKKLGFGEPYSTTLSTGDSSTKVMLDKLIAMVPHPMEQEKLNTLINQVSEVTQNSLFYSKRINRGHYKHFSLIKIFRSGDCLEIMPSFISFENESRDENWLRIVSKKHSWFKGHYEHRKFVVTKYDIEWIIKLIKREAEKRWS